MTHPLTVRAIDIGYGNTKLVVQANENTVQCESIPSRAPRAIKSSLSSAPNTLTQRRNEVLEVDGALYEVGPDTRLLNQPRILHADYALTPEYLALYKGALGKMKTSHIDFLITGLPVSHLEHHHQVVRDRLRGVHKISSGEVVTVDEVFVIAQPMGGLLDHCLDRSGSWRVERNIRYLLIDPGYFTLDWVIAEGLKELPSHSGSYPFGVSQILINLAREISQEIDRPFDDLDKLDEGLRTQKMRVLGTQLDLSQYRTPIIDLWGQALNALKNSVGDGRKFDHIFLAGGGAPLIEAAISELFPNHPLAISDDPIFANVRGFQYLGESMVRRAA